MAPALTRRALAISERQSAHALGVRMQSSAAKQSQNARTIDDLRTPALCCYPSVMEANAKAMLERATRLGCVLRPHVKTAKTLEAATIQTGGTKRRVVCSTLAEAEFLASGGFDDILYAVPITADKLAAADELNRRLERFHVMADHPSTVQQLTSRALTNPTKLTRPTKPLSVVVMVDCGYRRDGVDPHAEESVALVRALCASERTVFGGCSPLSRRLAEIHTCVLLLHVHVVADCTSSSNPPNSTAGYPGSTPTAATPTTPPMRRPSRRSPRQSAT